MVCIRIFKRYWVNLCKGVQDAPKECGVNTAVCRFNPIKKEYEILAKTKSEMMLFEGTPYAFK